MSDAYENVARGKLKLKSDSHIKKNKKKSKKKDVEKTVMLKSLSDYEDERNAVKNSAAYSGERKLTKAESAFKQQQEKMRNKRIMERASTTHKERVEKFNEHLDTLTEHFDIPKVSWTK